jgi:hypothetical protein
MNEIIEQLRGTGFATVANTTMPPDPVDRWRWFESLTGDAYAMTRMPVKPTPTGTTYTSTMEHAEFHTDYLGAWLPPDLQALHCIRPATRGGTSLLVDLWRLWGRLVELGIPFDELRELRQEGILASTGAERLMGFAFGRSYNLLGPGMDIDGLPLTAFADRHGLLHRIDLRQGDLLIFDNLRMGHGRTGFDDPQRLLEKLHSWRIEPVTTSGPFDAALREAAGAALHRIGPELDVAAATQVRERNRQVGVVDLETGSWSQAESILAKLFGGLRAPRTVGSGT